MNIDTKQSTISFDSKPIRKSISKDITNSDSQEVPFKKIKLTDEIEDKKPKSFENQSQNNNIIAMGNFKTPVNSQTNIFASSFDKYKKKTCIGSNNSSAPHAPNLSYTKALILLPSDINSQNKQERSEDTSIATFDPAILITPHFNKGFEENGNQKSENTIELDNKLYNCPQFSIKQIKFDTTCKLLIYILNSLI